MTRRKMDKQKFERADRASKLAIEAEREARETKTTRLREQRLSLEASIAPEVQKRKPTRATPARKIVS